MPSVVIWGGQSVPSVVIWGWAVSAKCSYMGVGGQCQAPTALPPGKGPDTHCTEGWLGLRANPDRYSKSDL